MLLVYIIASLMFTPYATVPREMDVVGLHSQIHVDHRIQTIVDHPIQTAVNRFILSLMH